MSALLPDSDTPSPDPEESSSVLPVCVCMGPAAGLLLYFLVDGLHLSYCLMIGAGVGVAVGQVLNFIQKK